MDFDSFAASMKQQGFEQVVQRVWEPHSKVEQHSHPFDARALGVRGEMWLTISDRAQHLLPGGTFEIPAHQLHSERYGAEGATYWVARRSVKAADSR